MHICADFLVKSVYETFPQKAMYPWVGTHKWQTFRNDYHKNRLHYDKLIRNIVDGASSKKSRARPRTINLNKSVGPLTDVHKRQVIKPSPQSLHSSNSNARFVDWMAIQPSAKPIKEHG